MGLFDATGLTLPVDVAKTVGELVFEKRFTDIEANKLKMFITFETGIKAKKYLTTMGVFNGLAGYVHTNCDITANADKITGSEKMWDPAYISDRWEQCYDELLTTFWKYMLKNGIAKENVEGTDYADFVKMRLEEYMSEMLMYRLIFFTDKAIVSGTNNSLSAGQVKYFSTNDGVIKQLQAIVATTPARRVTITQNANATYATQAFVAGDIAAKTATGYFNNLIYKAHMDLRRVPVGDRIIICTQTMADQYALERKDDTGLEIQYLRTENGFDTFKIDGVMILPMPTLDVLIDTYYNNGTKWLLGPHFAYHTTKDNVHVGTEEVANFSELKSFYSEYHKKWVVEFGFNFDVKVNIDRINQVSY